jgi:hypothetical protein
MKTAMRGILCPWEVWDFWAIQAFFLIIEELANFAAKAG